MSERVDVDAVGEALIRGEDISTEDIWALRNELTAYRAAHKAGAVWVDLLRKKGFPVLAEDLKKYRDSFEASVSDALAACEMATPKHPTT